MLLPAATTAGAADEPEALPAATTFDGVDDSAPLPATTIVEGVDGSMPPEVGPAGCANVVPLPPTPLTAGGIDNPEDWGAVVCSAAVDVIGETLTGAAVGLGCAAIDVTCEDVDDATTVLTGTLSSAVVIDCVAVECTPGLPPGVVDDSSVVPLSVADAADAFIELLPGVTAGGEGDTATELLRLVVVVVAEEDVDKALPIVIV